MRNAFLVALREYLENAKTKGFWIGVLMMPVIFTLSIQVPIFLEKRGTPSRHVVIVDQSGQFGEIIESALKDAERTAKGGARRVYNRVDLPLTKESLEEMTEELRPYLRGQKTATFQDRPVKIDAAILIPRDVN